MPGCPPQVAADSNPQDIDDIDDRQELRAVIGHHAQLCHGRDSAQCVASRNQLNHNLQWSCGLHADLVTPACGCVATTAGYEGVCAAQDEGTCASPEDPEGAMVCQWRAPDTPACRLGCPRRLVCGRRH